MYKHSGEGNEKNHIREPVRGDRVGARFWKWGS